MSSHSIDRLSVQQPREVRRRGAGRRALECHHLPRPEDLLDECVLQLWSCVCEISLEIYLCMILYIAR